MNFNAYALVAGLTATTLAALGASFSGSIPAASAVDTAGVAGLEAHLEAPKVSFEAPPHMVAGRPFEVTVEAVAGKNGAPLAGWIVSPSAFLVGGVPLGERTNEGTLQLPAGAHLQVTFDLTPHMQVEGDFELDFAKGLSETGPIGVTVHRGAPSGLDYMSMDAAQLDDYRVLMETNQGYMLLEMWPDKAPNHVRNFLDLVAAGFYDGIIFHRVIEGFMIQGGDPDGTGGGGSGRIVEDEFSSDAKHERGVLSAANTGQPNSATSQFFIMHAANPALDGRYSAYGMLIDGFDTLDAIATTKCIRTSPDPRAPASSPLQRQVIKRAIVVMAPDAGE